MINQFIQQQTFKIQLYTFSAIPKTSVMLCNVVLTCNKKSNKNTETAILDPILAFCYLNNRH